MLTRLAPLMAALLLGGCDAEPPNVSSQSTPRPAARLDPCQLVSRAEVEAAIGTEVAEGESSDTADVTGPSNSSLRQCNFYEPGDTWNPMLVLTVMRAPRSIARFEEQLAMAQQFARVEGIRVAGIGDAALWFQQSASLRVMTGNVQFVINDVVNHSKAGTEPGAALRKLALTIVQRRPLFEAGGADSAEQEAGE